LPNKSATFVIAAVLVLTGCDLIQQQMGIEDPASKAAKTDAEGKAVGGGLSPVRAGHRRLLLDLRLAAQGAHL